MVYLDENLNPIWLYDEDWLCCAVAAIVNEEIELYVLGGEDSDEFRITKESQMLWYMHEVPVIKTWDEYRSIALSKFRFPENKVFSLFNAPLSQEVEDVLKKLFTKGVIIRDGDKWSPNKEKQFSQKDVAYACYKTVGDCIEYDKALGRYEYQSTKNKLSCTAGLKSIFGYEFSNIRTQMVQGRLPKNWEIIDQL